MRHVRMLGVGLLALLALAAVTASAASAKSKLPEWGVCAPAENHEGHYGDSNCVVPAKKVFGAYNGGYEWHPLVEPPSGNAGAHLKFHEEGEPAQGPVSLTFADGYKITCATGLQPATEVILQSASLTNAPHWVWGDCHDSEGHGCETAGAGTENEINTEGPWETGFFHEPGGWTGRPQFISGKKTSTPSAGIVYTAAEKLGRIFQQVVCEGEVHAFVIGGLNKKEELTTEITPVNTMTTDYTAALSQADGLQGPATLEGKATHPLEALVNGERWETVGIEGTMLFPGTDVEHPNPFVHGEEVELKATP